MAPGFACTRPVNLRSTDLQLTEAQVWKGLEMKARRPDIFVPAITSCEVIKDDGNKVSRIVAFNGREKQREDIELHDNAVIYFDFADLPFRVLNILSYGPSGELLLTYAFSNGIPGYDEDGTKSVEDRNDMVGKIIDHSVSVIRALAQEGRL